MPTKHKRPAKEEAWDSYENDQKQGENELELKEIKNEHTAKTVSMKSFQITEHNIVKR